MTPRAPEVALWLAVAATAAPLLYLAPTEVLGFDAAWHVFIAGQDQWRHFWSEVRWNAHPPLFYLLLRGAIAAFGKLAAAYRLVPIAATIGSAWLVGRLVGRLVGDRWLPAIAAFAFGTSLTAVTVGLDVRAYPLAVLFLLGATLALVDLAERGFAAPGHGPRAAFAAATALALLTHYAAAVFLAASCAAVAAGAVLDRGFRHRLAAGLRRHPLANALAVAVPSAVLAAEYAVHIGQWTGLLSHVTPFLHDPGSEGTLSFLGRNTRALFALFVPALDHRPFASTLMVSEPALGGVATAALLAAAVAAVGWLALRPAGGAGGAGALAGRRLPPLLLAAMTGAIAVLGLLGRYPYGGALRHMFVLFPFAVVVLAQAVDRLATALPRRWGGAAVAAFALAAAGNTANWTARFEGVRGPLMKDQMVRFQELFERPPAVFVDPYNTVVFFMHHHDWEWRFVRRIRGAAPVDVWRVGHRRRGEELWLCRDRRGWLLDLASLPTYGRIRRCLDATGAGRVAVLRTQQRAIPPDFRVEQSGELAAAIAPAARLAVEEVVVEGEDVYAAFAAGPAAPARAPAAMLRTPESSEQPQRRSPP